MSLFEFRMPQQLGESIRGCVQLALLVLHNETNSSLRTVLNTRPVSDRMITQPELCQKHSESEIFRNIHWCLFSQHLRA